MNDAPDQSSLTALALMVSGYRLGLGRAAAQLGAPAESWGGGKIEVAAEEANMEGRLGMYLPAPYPYPGLRPFTPNEGAMFFGRARNVDEVRQKLKERRLVVVCGGSGSGKSSMLRAGLLPFLNSEHRIAGRDGTWYDAQFRPQTNPVGELVDSLTELLLPLIQTDRPESAETMGLDFDTARGPKGKAALRDALNARFQRACGVGRDAVLDTLLTITGRQLDRLDALATGGLRKPNPSLLLLLDQFEEVFRPEVSETGRAALLNLVVDLHAELAARQEGNGLFLAITMRSEELHRCAEHPGLTDVINSSLYLLELLDPNQDSDRVELHRAIVEPARRTFQMWGVPLDKNDRDSPFARGVPDWLLDGMAGLPRSLEHRPDQLPLLQHGLQAMWHKAMRDWSESLQPEQAVEIERRHLPGQPAASADRSQNNQAPPDLRACLQARADRAAYHAALRFVDQAAPEISDGTPALQAAFRALARRADGDRWVRRFAKQADIAAFLDAEAELARLTPAKRWEATRQALQVFLLRGYLAGGDGKDYDISHEALIRNWPQFQEFLRLPGEVAYALNRILEDVDPAKFENSDRSAKISAIPGVRSSAIALIGEGGRLPEKWGSEQITPTLQRQQIGASWGSDPMAALRKVVQVAKAANTARDEAVRSRKRAEKWGWGIVAAIPFLIALSVALYIEDTALNFKNQHAKADLAAERTANRQLGAQGLIGAMQSISAETSWPAGTRERAALQSFDMLEGTAGRTPDLTDLQNLAAQRWQAGLRTLLGEQIYVLKGSRETYTTPAPQCLNNPGNDSTTALPAVLNVLPGGPQVNVTLLRREKGLILQTSSREGTSDVSGNLAVLSSDKARICISADASVITLAVSGYYLPTLFQVYWRRCPDDALGVACKAKSVWLAELQQLSPPSPSQSLPDPSAAPCVEAITQSPDRPAAPAITEVRFSSAKLNPGVVPSSDCSDNKASHFVASYVPALSRPILIKSADAEDVRRVPCNSQGKSQAIEKISCEAGLTSEQMPVLATLQPQANGYWSLRVGKGSTPPIAVPLFAPRIVEAGLDSANDLVLFDGKGLAWKLILDLDHERVKPLLIERACYDSARTGACNFPPDLTLLMTAKEQSEPRPSESRPR